jgi:creatinine amidohydrolase/Fe(II)-dependent formamide hydrolase-like protein
MSWHEITVPKTLNTGPWLTAYSWPALAERVARESVILPICSIATPPAEIAKLGPLVMPPLFHEAMDRDLRDAMIARVQHCFPYVTGSGRRAKTPGKLEVVELPRRDWKSNQKHSIVAFSMDTAVEEHGPHLPLATDRIQSYAVLQQMEREFDGKLTLAPPLDYGQLLWGLPLGLSVDITADLVVRYVRGYADAISLLMNAAALYVVDTHGSAVHRQAVQDGLRGVKSHWIFRWVYEPLSDLTLGRGDAHAGGVETAVVENINPALVDRAWFPTRIDELERDQLSLPRCLEMVKEMPKFIEFAESSGWNGIVGKIRNYDDLDAAAMFEKMCDAARKDIRALL